MKFATLFILATLSVPAFADYFGCELNVQHNRRVDVEAPYKGRKVVAKSAGWTCTGTIDQEGFVQTTLQSPQANARRSDVGDGQSRVGFAIQDITSEEGDFITGVCTCGLR